MLKKIIAICLVLVFASGCLFSLKDLAVKSGTTEISVIGIDIVDEPIKE